MPILDPCRVCGHDLATEHRTIEGSYVQCQIDGCPCGKEEQ